MAENNGSLDERIVAGMSQLVSYQFLLREIDGTKTDKERLAAGKKLRDSLAQGIKKDDPKRNAKLDILSRDILPNPYLYVDQAMAEPTLNAVRPDYEANLDAIISSIGGKVNEQLAEASSMGNATGVMLQYLMPTEKYSARSKEEIYQEIIRELAQIGIRIRGNYMDSVNPQDEVVQKYLEDVKKLVKEEKQAEGQKNVYRINPEELKKYIKDPLIGSIIYAVSHQPETKSEEHQYKMAA